MKIGMMSAWNETSGTSIHAELVVEQWERKGHEIKIFSFIEKDFHGSCLIGNDERYVTRCFGTSIRSKYLDPIPFLKEDYDIFVVQDLEMLPADKLAKIFPQIKKKAKTVHVVHAGALPKDPSFYQFDWDALVCFDKRYEFFLREVFPEEIIHIIPFPCHRWVEGDKKEARDKLGLPQDEKIIFIFGQKWRHLLDVIPALERISKKYPLRLLIMSGAQRIAHELLSLPFVDTRKEVLEHPEIYDYLHAADAQVFGKHSSPNVVVSSTTHLTLGSGCPIVVRDSNFFEMMPNEVLKYRNLEELEQALTSAFTKDEKYEAVMRAAKKYVEKNSAEKVAEKFISLFESLS